MNKPHKHAELIKQWADNPSLEIQCRLAEGHWVNCCNYFNWNTSLEYRVKPQPHKWQKEIDAWKAGKMVQWKRVDDKHWNGCLHTSVNLSVFDEIPYVFRIKPEPVVRGTKMVISNDPQVGPTLLQVPSSREDYNLKLTFEDGKLVAAEVL
jgi:hypothetical protein